MQVYMKAQAQHANIRTHIHTHGCLVFEGLHGSYWCTDAFAFVFVFAFVYIV